MDKITADDPIAQSADIVSENITQLAELFPEAITEGKIDFEVLKQLLGAAVDERDERYGLNWHGKRRARQLALTPSLGTLRPCPKESVDWDNTQNLMIEGDNLEVLKLLQKSYSGKVKLIYIDPPYNTGKDFVYADKFRNRIEHYLEVTGQKESEVKNTTNSESSGRFHTAWLNMIYPRLKAARNLLRDDGVILISIDDNEMDRLRIACNEVFGIENCVATLVWEKGRKNDAKLFSVGHEYVLVYAKSLGKLKELKTLWREEKPGAKEIWDKYLELREVHGEDNGAIEEDISEWFSSLPKKDPSKKWSRYKRIDDNGPWRDRDISWPGGDGPRYDVPHPDTGEPCAVPERGWIYSTPEEMQRQIKLGTIEFRDDHTEPPFRKAHLRPLPDETDGDETLNDGIEEELDDSEDGDEEEGLATQVRGSYFYKQSQSTVKYLRKLLGAKAFDNPKDHVELAKLFKYVTCNDPNAIVMDFFAGSGSAAHAVMELNGEDNGHRRFVLVQLPEKLDPKNKKQKTAAKFCKDHKRPLNLAELTKQRLIYAANEVAENAKEGKPDLGFRVFKLDSSNIETWDPNREDLDGSIEDHVDHVKEKRSDDDVMYELLLKLGLDLCVPIEQRTIAGKTVHSIGAGVLFACLDKAITTDDVEPLAHGIVEWHKELAPAGDSTVVFRDSAFGTEDKDRDVVKTNLSAILQQHGLKNVRSL